MNIGQHVDVSMVESLLQEAMKSSEDHFDSKANLMYFIDQATVRSTSIYLRISPQRRGKFEARERGQTEAEEIRRRDSRANRQQQQIVERDPTIPQPPK